MAICYIRYTYLITISIVKVRFSVIKSLYSCWVIYNAVDCFTKAFQTKTNHSCKKLSWNIITLFVGGKPMCTISISKCNKCVMFTYDFRENIINSLFNLFSLSKVISTWTTITKKRVIQCTCIWKVKENDYYVHLQTSHPWHFIH